MAKYARPRSLSESRPKVGIFCHIQSITYNYYIFGFLSIDYIENPRADIQSYRPALISARGLF